MTILFPVPPLEDQQKIIASISERTAQIQDLVSVIQREIFELQEFKFRLVSDVVRGKIDVRNIPIPDYEYVDEEPDVVDSDEDAEEQEDE